MNNQLAPIFNSTLVSSALSAAYELGLIEELADRKIIEINQFCQDQNLHEPSVKAIILALCCSNICEIDPTHSTVKPGASFTEAYQYKGYFLWLIRGYGHMLQNLASITKNENRHDDFINRDGKYIALGGRDYGQQFVDDYFQTLMQDFPYHCIADLGCGSGAKLIDIVTKNPTLRAIGLDVNPGAVKTAQMAVQTAQLQTNIKIIEADISQLQPQPDFEEVDVVFSFFNGHDLWPRHKCLKFLQNLYIAFPKIKRFLLCDTYRSDVVPSANIPIFTLGFEFTHGVMGQYIPSLTEWLDLFADSGWNCVEHREIGIPFSAIFDLRPH
ncbi:class I SAM-dependent methyltransferase [Roseofilum sp. BLCC_M91]|uniref:Class I SAM-dependent methyltransferase n=1 Tax=Roseofilum halophilum BLCC-M91 TaxID=3022259 RepID=A0ABT7BEJ0_9CYAN|nr:class I SAM-dependent methyltransferase [Roseofilum halophilum]MDJ1177500.1 class I SAM-dependent methyltransferase [Roseofilum halophilum BLCC-M91]